MFYFAYGSNLLQKRMKYRVPSTKLRTTGALREYKLVFNLMVGGSGKCDIVETRDPKDEVWGAIYEIPFWRISLLDKYEGFPSIYHRKTIPILGVDGNRYDCQVYIGTGRWHRNILPYDWYLYHVLLGACQLDLPQEYQRKLAQVKSQKDQSKARFYIESSFWE